MARYIGAVSVCRLGGCVDVWYECVPHDSTVIHMAMVCGCGRVCRMEVSYCTPADALPRWCAGCLSAGHGVPSGDIRSAKRPNLPLQISPNNKRPLPPPSSFHKPYMPHPSPKSIYPHTHPISRALPTYQRASQVLTPTPNHPWYYPTRPLRRAHKAKRHAPT